VVPEGDHAEARNHWEGVVWFGGSTSLGLPPPGGVVVPVGDHAKGRNQREGVLTAQAEACDRQLVW